jgi:hypothetical protein
VPVLIDYLVAAAIAIAGMLSLLIFGTEIIRMNAEARDRWQAKSALADFEGRWQISGDRLPAGMICPQPGREWIAQWCQSRAVVTLRNSSVAVDPNLHEITVTWGSDDRTLTSPLAVTRKLSTPHPE